MKKYVVGVSSPNEDIVLKKVQAENELYAMCHAVYYHYDWDVLSENENHLSFSTVDEAIDYFIQGDVYVSKPLEVNW